MKLKLLEDNIIENIDDIGYGNNFVDTTPKEWSKNKIISWISLKLKSSGLWKTISKELEDKPQTERKYSQKTHLIKNLSKIYNEFLKITNEETHYLIKK